MCLGSRQNIQIVETCFPAWSPDDKHQLEMTEWKKAIVAAACILQQHFLTRITSPVKGNKTWQKHRLFFYLQWSDQPKWLNDVQERRPWNEGK